MTTPAWIEVDRRQPPLFTPALVCDAKNELVGVATLNMVCDESWWACPETDQVLSFTPTHWLPIPEFPS